MPSRKESLQSLIEAARRSVRGMWKDLPPESRQARGEIDRWTPKDHLAHLTFWNARSLQRLEHILGGPEVEALEEHFQETNERVFREHADRPAEELYSWCEATYDGLLSALARLPDKTLDDRERFPWTRGRPLWTDLVFTPVYHTIHHVCDVLIAQARHQEAQSLQERFAEQMAAVDPEPSWQGTVAYNLACFYSLHDLPELALDRLKSAFAQNPSLIEWSRQDSDLDSLRDLPAFQGLIGGSEAQP